MTGLAEIGHIPPEPYSVRLVTEMTSDQLVAFVENRQKLRLQVQLAAHKIRKADAEMQSPAVISQRLEREHDKLQKVMEKYQRAEEAYTKQLSNVVALRSQLGLEDHNG